MYHVDRQENTVALSIRVEAVVDSFNPYFHMHHLPLDQNYKVPRHADRFVVEQELGRLKRDVKQLLDVYDRKVGSPDNAVIAHAFKTVLNRDDYTYSRLFKSALNLWSAEQTVLRPNSVAFVP